MAIDEKAAFYWRHRERIEEWAALVHQTRSALVHSFREAFDDLVPEPGAPAWEWRDELYGSGWSCIRLPLDEGRGIHVGVYWIPNGKSGRGVWPEFAVSAAPPSEFPEYWPFKAHLGPIAARYRMTGNSEGAFLWFGQIPLLSELSIDECAQATLASVKAARADLLPESVGFFNSQA